MLDEERRDGVFDLLVITVFAFVFVVRFSTFPLQP